MWFRKAKNKTEPGQYPGIPTALDGKTAALAVESMASDNILIQSDDQLQAVTRTASVRFPASRAQVEKITQLQHLPAELTGRCATGLRSGALVDSMAGWSEGLSGMAGKRLAAVIHLISRCRERQAWALHGSHDDYLAASQTGVVQMFARNVQEVADLGLIARRVAESALIPVLCAQDFHSTADSVQSLRLPETALAEAYLGRPQDSVPACSKAQEVLFGPTRRRMPRLVDLDHPAGVGGVQGQESYFRSIAAQHAFFVEPVAGQITQAMDEFASLTHRQYQPVGAYRLEDAEYVVLAMGAVVDQLCACADHLRATENLRVGVLNLTLWRPFPGQALSQLLLGKRALTVLESTETPLAEDLPMMSEVRAALAKAGENGTQAADNPPHPGYAAYTRSKPAPALYSAICGIGTSMPSLAELAAVVKNMLPGGTGRRRAFVGVEFSRVNRRYPYLQVLQQSLASSYPGLESICLPPASIKPPVFDGSLVRMHALSGEGGIAAGNLFARACATGLDVFVKTHSQGGVESGLQRANLDIQYADHYPNGYYQAADIMLVAGVSLLHDIPEDAIRAEGTLVVSANQDPGQMWRGLPRRVTEWIKTRRLSVYLLDARAIALTSGDGPGHLDQLSIWAMLGCALTLIDPEDSSRAAVNEALNGLLTELFATDKATVEEILAAVAKGGKESIAVEWSQWKDERTAPETERAAPWTAAAAGANNPDLFDPSRFWRSVGFLYDSGDEQDTLVDPYLATGIMPARSSAHRDMASYRLSLPRWLPENCTGCGLCWSHCPDSALPSTVQTVQALIDTGIALCKADGQAMTQLARIAGHLSTQASRLVAKDDLHQYTMAGPLLAEAYGQLTAKMGLEGEALAAMTADFEHVHQRLESWPFARTERYFAGAAKDERRLLSIGINPVNCKACGLCMAVCPEDAMTWETQTPERVEREQHNLALQMDMPKVPVDQLTQFISQDDLDSELARLLNRDSYLSMVGGDSALPGHPGKTAVHLVSAAVDSVMQQRYLEHMVHLQELVEKLKSKIQDALSGVVRIDDFDSFSASLRSLDKGRLGSSELAGALGRASLEQGLDKQRLDHLNELMLSLVAQRAVYHAGRARMVLALQRGEITLWSGSYPDNPHASPWLSHDRGEAPALAQGLFEGMSRRLVQELSVCRQAELELDDEYDPLVHSTLADTLTWDDLDTRERALLAPVVMVADANAVHWEDIDKVLAGRRPITMLLLDSGGLAVADDPARHAGLAHVERALDQGTNFVVQGSTGNPAHLVRAVVTSLDWSGPSLLRVYAPDTMENGLSGQYVAEDAGLALASRAVPLYTFNPGLPESPLSLEGNPEPGADWAANLLEARTTGGGIETLKTVLTPADWAVHQLRFRSHFTLLGKGHLADDMRPLAALLALTPDKRTGLRPYIQLLDASGRLVIALVSTQMAAACEQALLNWRALKSRVSNVVKPATQAAPSPQADTSDQPAPAPTRECDDQVLVERLLALCGYTSDPEYFSQTLREFLARQTPKPGEGEDHV